MFWDGVLVGFFVGVLVAFFVTLLIVMNIQKKILIKEKRIKQIQRDSRISSRRFRV
jgi:hypothetical protein